MSQAAGTSANTNEHRAAGIWPGYWNTDRSSSHFCEIVAHTRAASVFSLHKAPNHGSLCTPDDKGLDRPKTRKKKNASRSESNLCSKRAEVVEWTRTRVHNLSVTGSNPTARTFLFFAPFRLKMKRAEKVFPASTAEENATQNAEK